MRTVVGWIAGIGALVLVLGGFYRGISAGEAKSSLADLPSVDCGDGREALFEPVTANGTTTLRMKCVPIAAHLSRQVAAPVYAAPAPPPVATPARSSARGEPDTRARARWRGPSGERRSFLEGQRADHRQLCGSRGRNRSAGQR